MLLKEQVKRLIIFNNKTYNTYEKYNFSPNEGLEAFNKCTT